MKAILPESFDTFFVSTWKEIISGKKTTHDLLSQTVQLTSDKLEKIENLAWTRLKNYSNIFSIKDIELIDKNNDFKNIYLKALSNDILNENMLLPLFNKISNKDEFYKNIRSFKTLMDCDKNSINVWVSLVINKELEIENMLPVAAWDWDSKRNNIIKKTSGSEKIDFFTKNKEKWYNFQTKTTSNKNFKSKLGYRISLIKSRKNLLNPLGIKIDNNTDYAFAWGETIKIKDLYLRQGKIKKIKDHELGNNPELDIIKLIKSNIPYQKSNLISNQKKYSQLWFKLLKDLNFSYEDIHGNLVNHTFLNINYIKNSFYLPIIKNLKEKPDNIGDIRFNHFISEEQKNSESLFSWLNLLVDKNVDMFKTVSQKCPFSQLLIYLSYQERNYYENFIKEDSFVKNLWINSSYKQKTQVFKEYFSHWEELKKNHLETDFPNRYHSWNNKTIIIDIFDMFLQKNLFNEHPEKNQSVLNLLEKYTKDDLIKKLFESIAVENNKGYLERTLEEKDKQTQRKLKI